MDGAAGGAPDDAGVGAPAASEEVEGVAIDALLARLDRQRTNSRETKESEVFLASLFF